MKTLRRRLFGSHLQVMLVALLVVLVGVLIVGVLYEIFGGRRGFDPGRGEQGGPLGLLVGLGAAALAAALVSWRVTKRLAAPLEAVGDAARKLAAGRYDVRLPGSDTLELDALATDVNYLAAELQETEERRLRLIGDVAHELRNPLSTIEGTMEALLDGVVEPDEETFARIGREAARLRRLADDLSSLSAAGELGRLDQESVDLAAIANHVVDQLEPQARAKGLEMSLDAAPAIVAGDRDRLTQVLVNIVGNAVQYSDAGTISVAVSGDAGWARVTVSDQGRGLSDADQSRIFERFYRVDEQFTDGTGVGLAIAKLIVDAHNGVITAASAGVGQGTTFAVDLPLSGSAANAPR